MHIFIRHKSTLRKIFFIQVSNRDGSITVVAKQVNNLNAYSTKESSVISPLNLLTYSNRRITVHQSGRVNYHENKQINYNDPLTEISRLTWIYTLQISNLELCAQFRGGIIPGQEDVVIDVFELSARPIYLSLYLRPLGSELLGGEIVLMRPAEGYEVMLLISQASFRNTCEYIDRANSFIPRCGYYLNQRMPEDSAMIAYHQAITGSRELIIHQPNGEGEIRLVFSVPMRVAPKFRITLIDQEMCVSDLDVRRDTRSENVSLIFKVRNQKTSKIIKESVVFSRIELDSEL